MKTLVTGGAGVLGSYIDGMRYDHTALDITDLAKVMQVCEEVRPKAIVHCAALTDLPFCERNPEKAYLVNVVGTYHLALAARRVGAKLVYISTSDVFEGTKKEPYVPADVPNPTTVYGRSKHLGELAVSGILDDYLIIRISWMFGGGPGRDNKFVGKLLKQGPVPEVRAVTDKRASPSWGKDVAEVIYKLIEEDRRGIYHVGGGVATKYEMAEELVSIMGWDTKVISAKSSDFPSAYTIGENESMVSAPLLRSWQEALKEYIETEWKG